MKIALASDHAGYELKREISAFLAEKKIAFEDFGCHTPESVDYVDFAEKAAREVCAGRLNRAILICGTGMGMSMVANKFKGLRATLCYDSYTAEMSRAHNNSNCLTLGGRTTPPDQALRIIQIWLATDFEGGRHLRRLEKLSRLEDQNFRQEERDDVFI